MPADARRRAAAVALVTLLGLALRGHGLARQEPLTDEVQAAYTAEGYVAGGQTEPTMPHHPSLRNLLVAASLRAFGPGALGLRFFSLLFGALAVPLLAAVVFRATGRTVAAVGAAFLLAVDPLHVAFSRQAFQETHVVFLALLGAAIALAWLERAYAGSPRWPDGLLPVAGAVFGLALAAKFQAVFPLAVVAIAIVVRAVRARDPATVVLAFVSFAVVPLVVLAVTDAPWFSRGYDLGDWAFMRRAVLDRMSTHYVPTTNELNPDRSAWAWFVKPLLGYASFSMAGSRPSVSVGTGNPLVWLLVLPAAAAAVARPALRRRTLLLQALFWASYVPFLVAGRPVFFLTAMAPAPFGFALVAAAADDLLWERRRALLAAWLAAVFATSLVLMPLATGTALDDAVGRVLVERYDPQRVAPGR